MENKMHAKQMFKCAICGKTYDDVKARMECESKCLKHQEIEAAKAAEAKKQEEYMNSKAKVDEAFATAYKLRDEHVKKYGSYTYVHMDDITNSLKNQYWPSLAEAFKFRYM